MDFIYIYVKTKRFNTVFLRITAVCSECLRANVSTVKFIITINEHLFDPIINEERLKFIQVQVEHQAQSHTAVLPQEVESDDDSEVEYETSQRFQFRPDTLAGEEREEVIIEIRKKLFLT